MKVAIVGGTGLIGSAVAAHLYSRGHSIVSLSRSAGDASANGVAIDISKANSSSYCLGVEAIVNCAGVLQDGPNESVAMVHHRGIARACLRLVSSLGSAGSSISQLSAWTGKPPAPFPGRSLRATKP